MYRKPETMNCVRTLLLAFLLAILPPVTHALPYGTFNEDLTTPQAAFVDLLIALGLEGVSSKEAAELTEEMWLLWTRNKRAFNPDDLEFASTIVGRALNLYNIAESAANGDVYNTAWNAAVTALTEAIALFDKSQFASYFGPVGGSAGVGIIAIGVKLTIDSFLEAESARRGVNIEQLKYMVLFDPMLRPRRTELVVDEKAINYVLQVYVAQNHKQGRTYLKQYVEDVLGRTWPEVWRDPTWWERNAYGISSGMFEGKEHMDELRLYISAFLVDIAAQLKAQKAAADAVKENADKKAALVALDRKFKIMRKLSGLKPVDVAQAKAEWKAIQGRLNSFNQRSAPEVTAELAGQLESIESLDESLGRFIVSIQGGLFKPDIAQLWTQAKRAREMLGKAKDSLEGQAESVWQNELAEISKGKGVKWPLAPYDIELDAKACVNEARAIYAAGKWAGKASVEFEDADGSRRSLDRLSWELGEAAGEYRELYQREKEKLIPDHYNGYADPASRSVKEETAALIEAIQQLKEKEKETGEPQPEISYYKAELEGLRAAWDRFTKKYSDMVRGTLASLDLRWRECTVEHERLAEKGKDLVRTVSRLLETPRITAAPNYALHVLRGIEQDVATAQAYGGLPDLSRSPSIRSAASFQDLADALSVIEGKQMRNAVSRAVQGLPERLEQGHFAQFDAWEKELRATLQKVEDQQVALARVPGGTEMAATLMQGKALPHDAAKKEVSAALVQLAKARALLDTLKGKAESAEQAYLHYQENQTFLGTLRSRLNEMANILALQFRGDHDWMGEWWLQSGSNLAWTHGPGYASLSLSHAELRMIVSAGQSLLASGSGEWLGKANPVLYGIVAKRLKFAERALQDPRQDKAISFLGTHVSLAELTQMAQRVDTDEQARGTWQGFLGIEGLGGDFGRLQSQLGPRVAAAIERMAKQRAAEQAALQAERERAIQAGIAEIERAFKGLRPGGDDTEETAWKLNERIDQMFGKPGMTAEQNVYLQRLRDRIGDFIAEHQAQIAQAGRQSLDEIRRMYREFAVAYNNQNLDAVIGHLADNWEAGDGALVEDIEDALGNSFYVFDEIDFSISSMTIKELGDRRYQVTYNVNITGQIRRQRLTHKEQGTVADEVAITDAGPRITTTRGTLVIR